MLGETGDRHSEAGLACGLPMRRLHRLYRRGYRMFAFVAERLGTLSVQALRSGFVVKRRSHHIPVCEAPLRRHTVKHVIISSIHAFTECMQVSGA